MKLYKNLVGIVVISIISILIIGLIIFATTIMSKNKELNGISLHISIVL